MRHNRYKRGGLAPFCCGAFYLFHVKQEDHFMLSTAILPISLGILA